LSVQALRLDPTRVRLRVVLANDRLPALERVLDMAKRTHAIAAINAGFFTPVGGPAGLLLVDHQPVGFGPNPRGAVAIVDGADRTRLAFSRAQLRAAPGLLGSARAGLGFWSPDGHDLSAWHDARDVVGGAGLLVEDGIAVTDVGVERMRDDFPVVRHPRSVIGVDADGVIWLIAVDGRRPGHSVGMSFRELHRLTAMLGLRDALNLDGGGSTTLVVKDVVVNRPTDLTGPRAVSDAIVVLPR
jgi:exopolysaccharide biosynthesis protein